METRMMGPLTGAEARAYRQPPTAASAVPAAASTRINVYRKGRAKASLPVQLIERCLGQPSLRRDRIHGDDLVEEPGGALTVPTVHREDAEPVERFAPG